jgi:hypothetical protein
MSNHLPRFGAACFSALAALAAGPEARAQWVMGSTQFAPANNFFTGLIAEFQVPSPPPSGTTTTASSIWSGISGGSPSTVLQGVLGYNYTTLTSGFVAGWSMHNEVQPGEHYGPSIPVNTGDVILVEIYWNVNDPGPNCADMYGEGRPLGSGCNYILYWQDTYTGATDTYAYALPSSVSLYYAQGLIFETPQPGQAMTCNDFPAGSALGYEDLYVDLQGNPYAAVSMNLVANQQDSNPPGFQYPLFASGFNQRCPFSTSTSGDETVLTF